MARRLRPPGWQIWGYRTVSNGCLATSGHRAHLATSFRTPSVPMGAKVYQYLRRRSFKGHNVCPLWLSARFRSLLLTFHSWGQSAGGASVGLHLVANGGNTEGLFHAAFMESGFPMPNGDTRQGQRWYDLLVKQSGCAGAIDTLSCIRDTVPDEVINAVQDKTPYVFSREASKLMYRH